ncbi:hypothetical protein [Bradyrhizobium sp. STM 3566]|uniref:hypothetical protein n=1 Tax=Bradyrhizobium sp. STM 3566 TaxID=578928 RepID=UPI00388F02D9
MPNIRSFDAPQGLGINPTETGINATAAAARRIGSSYREAADAYADLGSRIGSTIRDVGDIAVKYEDHREISAGAAKFAELQDNLTQEWNERAKTADPNDPSVAAKFREEVVEPALEKFSGAFNTENSQRFAEQKVEYLRNHMFQKTAADMSTLAGIAVRKNLADTTTSMTNTAITDPSSVPTLLSGLDHSISGVVGSSPTLSATDAARVTSEVSTEVKRKIVHAGAIGAIQKSSDPERTAEDWIKKYPDLIDGSEAKALAINARQQIRARNYDEQVERRRAKEAAQDKSTELSNQYLIDVRSRDPRIASDPTAVKILNDPNLTKQDKNNLLNYVDRTLKPETDTRISQQTFVGLLRDLRAPDADPDKVMQKAWDARLMDPGKAGSLTEHDFNQFRQEVVARKTPEGAALECDRALFFKQYAGTIAGPQYSAAVGDPKLYNAEADARRMESMLRSKGLDPHLAYDPSSEYFLGRPQRLQKWQQSMQMDLQLRAEGPAAATPTRPEVPFELRGIAALSYSKSRNMWRDDTSGKLYDASGKEVGK